MWVFKRKPNFTCDNFPDNLCSSPHSIGQCHVDFDGDTFKRDTVGTDPSSYAMYKDGADFKLRSTWRNSFTNSVQLNKARTGPLRHLSELYDTLYMSEAESLTDVSTASPSAATDSTLNSPLSFSEEVKLSLQDSFPPTKNESRKAVHGSNHQRQNALDLRKESVPSVYVFENQDDGALSEWSDDGEAITDCDRQANQTVKSNQFFTAASQSQNSVNETKNSYKKRPVSSYSTNKQSNYKSSPANAKHEDDIFTPAETPVFANRVKRETEHAGRHLTQYRPQEESECETDFDFTDNFKGQSTIMRAREYSFLQNSEKSPTMESISLRNRVLPFIRIAKSNLPTLYQLGITESSSNPKENESRTPIADSEDNYSNPGNCFSPAIGLQEHLGGLQEHLDGVQQNKRLSTQLLTPRCNYDLFSFANGDYSEENMPNVMAERRKSVRVSLCRSPRSPRGPQNHRRPAVCNSPDSPNVRYTIPELQKMVL